MKKFLLFITFALCVTTVNAEENHFLSQCNDGRVVEIVIEDCGDLTPDDVDALLDTADRLCKMV